MLALRTPTSRRADRRRSSHSAAVSVRPAVAATAREREAAGPEDRALYRCPCGYTFEADVSASVGCPHCGTDQAW